MKQCKTCKHWNQQTEDFGECDSPKIMGGIGMNDADNPAIHVPDVFTFSGGHHSVGMNFGCVHHEDK